jgi:pimeloyl-ACP methyl ester carboxylesterase
VESANELGWTDALRLPVLRAGLQFLARKTGAPAKIIEEFLTDVAYYLELAEMRKAVLGIVEDALRTALPGGGEVVVVGHSLGSVVAYDLLTDLPSEYEVRLFVTAGSPLGFPIVQKNLHGHQAGQPVRVPRTVPASRAAWLNAYDERDFVSLVHPLAGRFTEHAAGQLRDERTINSSANPHSIADYLSDPDVAGPIGRAVHA